jgi:hypothetical protein
LPLLLLALRRTPSLSLTLILLRIDIQRQDPIQQSFRPSRKLVRVIGLGIRRSGEEMRQFGECLRFLVGCEGGKRRMESRVCRGHGRQILLVMVLPLAVDKMGECIYRLSHLSCRMSICRSMSTASSSLSTSRQFHFCHVISGRRAVIRKVICFRASKSPLPAIPRFASDPRWVTDRPPAHRLSTSFRFDTTCASLRTSPLVVDIINIDKLVIMANPILQTLGRFGMALQPQTPSLDYTGLEYRWKNFVFRPAEFQKEAVFAGMLGLLMLVYFLGKKWNEQKARAW